MSLPLLIIFRRLSTSTPLRRSFLSPAYKSRQLWDERFSCPLLSGEDSLIRSINSKIILGSGLNNVEMDIFINVTTPDKEELEQLKESADSLRKFRRTLSAHTMLPSTPHAICRLFLYSERISSIVNLLENRVDYGVFPDPFAMNLLLNEALDKDDLVSASRLAVLVMLQEEFSINPITDRLSLFAVAKYVELRTNFDDWKIESNDPALESFADANQVEEKFEVADKKKSEDDDEDEDEDDAEYIRVPFLRNPYNDNHFDVTNPRVLCGKVLSAAGKVFMKDNQDIGLSSTLLGSVLQGKWSDASKIISDNATNSNLGSMKSLLKFYIDNLHGVEGPSEELKENLVSCIDKFQEAGKSLGELVELDCNRLNEYETQDIEVLRNSLVDWSKRRLATQKATEEKVARDRLIEEIKAKKLALSRKEDYLYFYDKLKKARKTRIEYD